MRKSVPVGLLSLFLVACQPPDPPEPDAALSFGSPALTFRAKTGERRNVPLDLRNAGRAPVAYQVQLPSDDSYQAADTVFFDADPDALAGEAPAGGSKALTVAVQCPVTPGTYTNSLRVAYLDAAGVQRFADLSVQAECEEAPIPTVVADTTRVLDAATLSMLTSFDPATGLLTFTGRSPLVDALAVDDVLVAPPVGAAPEGLMVVATGVERAGNVTTVRTQPAGLMDVFESADIDVHFEPAGDEVIPARVQDGAGTVRVQAASLRTSLDQVLLDLDDNPNTGNDQVRVSGNFSLAPRHEFRHRFVVLYKTVRIFRKKIKIPIGASVDARIGAGVAENMNLRLYSSGPLTIDKSAEKTLFSKVGTPIVIPVGPVPLTFVPKYTLDARANFNAQAEFDVGFTQGLEFLAGVQVGGGGVGPYFTSSSTFTRRIDKLTGSVNGGVSLVGGVTFALYGTVGPYLGMGVGPKFNANVVQGPPVEVNWNLSGCVSGEAGIRSALALNVRLFGFRIPVKLPEKRWELVNACTRWADGRIVIPVNRPPQVTGLTADVPEPLGSNCDHFIGAVFQDPDGDAATLTWNPPPADVYRDYTRPGTESAIYREGSFPPGTQTISVTVRDSKGAQVTHSAPFRFAREGNCPIG